MLKASHQLASFIPSMLLLCAHGNSARAEVVVHSSLGYDVHISVVPIDIVAGSNCPYGYTYKVRMSYTITFSGAGAPAQMYTLQGTVGCGPNSHFFDLPNGPASGTVNSANGWRGVSDCATATVASLNCTEVKVQIQGPGIPDQWVSIPASTLPITLVSFHATLQKGAVHLEWATASEQNNAFFTVERSADAVEFMPALQLPGAGNSNGMLHYSTVDDAPLPGISYYRLKQTDLDGNYSYSPTVVVLGDLHAHCFHVFPNPGNSSEINLPADVIGKQLEVLSITGEVLYSSTLVSNRITGLSLSAGTYLLRVIDQRTGASEQCRLVRL